MYYKQAKFHKYDSYNIDNSSKNLIIISLERQIIEVFSLQTFEYIWRKNLKQVT